MPATISEIKVFDKNNGDIEIGHITFPPEGVFSIPLTVTAKLKDIYAYTIAWIAGTQWFSKASNPVHLLVNCDVKYPALPSFDAIRIATGTDSYNCDFSYNLTASFDVNNNFKFEVKHKKSGDADYTTVLDTPDKSSNDFSYTLPLDITDQDIYYVKARTQDVLGDYGDSSPVKEIVKGDILIGYPDGADIIAFGYFDGSDTIAMII